MSLKLRAGLGLATIILTIVSIIGGAVTRLETRFAALDTRLGKLESAIKVLNASTIDERYKQAIKELMAEAQQASAGGLTPHALILGNGSADVKSAKQPQVHRFGGPFPADAGAAADAPAVKVPQWEIMPWDKRNYPANWDEVVSEVNSRSGGRCECRGECGLHRTRPGPRRCIERNGEKAQWARGKVVLTTAHLCECQPLCGNLAHLKHMCQRCHNRVDVPLRKRHRRERRERESGQARLFL